MISSSRRAQAGRSRRSAGARLAQRLLLASLCVFSGTLLAAPKTDVVVLANGDRITGEIKSLEYNQLKLSTYDMGTVYIEWDKIASLKSDQYLLLERTDGTRYYGQLVAGEKNDSTLRVKRSARGSLTRPGGRTFVAARCLSESPRSARAFSAAASSFSTISG